MGLGSPQLQVVVTTGVRGGTSSGTFSYFDHTVRLSHVHLLSLVVTGSNATLFGTANLSDGSTVSFQLDVSVSRLGGTLRMHLSNGNDSGQFSAPVVRITP